METIFSNWKVNSKNKTIVHTNVNFIDIEVWHNDQQVDEAKSIAKLIAAAPELLEALTELSEFCERFFTGVAGKPCRVKAIEAIKKATE